MIDQAVQYMSTPAYMPTLFNAGALLCWLVVAYLFLKLLDQGMSKQNTAFRKTFHEADANYRMVYYTGRFIAVLWCGVQILPV